MENTGDVYKLIIKDAYLEDTGDYSCEISNDTGRQSAPFRITVKGSFYI